jgi:hypothetical protein
MGFAPARHGLLTIKCLTMNCCCLPALLALPVSILALPWCYMGRDLGWLWACFILAMHGRGALVTLVWLYTGAALAPHQVGLGLCSHLVLPWYCAVVGPVWVIDWCWLGAVCAIPLLLPGMALAWHWLACNWCWMVLDYLAPGAAPA